MRIAVLCPLYNAEEYLENLIYSLENQIEKDFTVYFLNDCSKDGTANKLLKLLSVSTIKFRYLENKENLGYIKSINKLWHQTDEEVIAFHDADDFVDSNFFQAIKEAIKGADFSCCNYQRVAKYFRVRNTHSGNFEIFKNQKTVGSAIAFHRKILKNPNNLFHEIFEKIGGEDIYLLNYLKQNHQGVFIENTFYYYRFNPDSITNKNNILQAKLVNLIIPFLRIKNYNKPPKILKILCNSQFGSLTIPIDYILKCFRKFIQQMNRK